MTTSVEALAFLAARASVEALCGAAFSFELFSQTFAEVSAACEAPAFCALERLDFGTFAEVFAALSCEELECVREEAVEIRKVLGRFSEIHLSDKAIEDALVLALMRFNETPPIVTSFTPCQMRRWSQCWRAGALAELFLALAGVEARNFTRPASQVGTSKIEEYMNLHARYEQEFGTLAESIKRHLNLSSGFSLGWGWWRGN